MADIPQQDLLESLKRKDAPVVVDVRSGMEYNAGHIQGALHIPFFSVLWRKRKLPADKRHPIVLTCEHGPRAGIAKFLLSLSGYRNVRHLEGHMSAWKNNNMPTVSS
mgnify:CR=1 FL=1